MELVLGVEVGDGQTHERTNGQTVGAIDVCYLLFAVVARLTGCIAAAIQERGGSA